MKKFAAHVVLLLAATILLRAHTVTLYWQPAKPGSAKVITRIYRTNYNVFKNACGPTYHLKIGTRKDSWTDTTVANDTTYCYQARSYDKVTGEESADDNPVIFVVVPK